MKKYLLLILTFAILFIIISCAQPDTTSSAEQPIIYSLTLAVNDNVTMSYPTLDQILPYDNHTCNDNQSLQSNKPPCINVDDNLSIQLVAKIPYDMTIYIQQASAIKEPAMIFYTTTTLQVPILYMHYQERKLIVGNNSIEVPIEPDNTYYIFAKLCSYGVTQKLDCNMVSKYIPIYFR